MRPEPARASKSHPRITQSQQEPPKNHQEPARANQSQPVANKNIYFTLLFLLEHSYIFLYERGLATYFQVCISGGHEMKLIMSWKKNQYTKNK